nr:MAG TPA: hypothetical protein [Caudoviricetes sp.]
MHLRKGEQSMKIINTANGKVLADVISNRRMSIEEAIELVGYDLSQCDDEGAYIDDDGERFWLEDCEEVDED